MTEGPRVLFVSKPIAPPWHDGSKNLVRDVAAHLVRARPTVLTTRGAPPVGERVLLEPVYSDAGRFAPALAANVRVLGRLLRGDPHDLWHFVFAPNAASSTAARIAGGVRKALGWRGAVVQTVASAPVSFDNVRRWIFGDRVIALTEWMRARLIAAGVGARRLRVIPPCARPPDAPTPASMRRVREALRLGDAPVILYPGDYEVSRGAQTVARAVKRIAAAIPEAVVVFACRAKTKEAAPAQSALLEMLRAERLEDRTRHAGEVNDMPALLGCSRCVAFPVDDLFGKVDLPLVLLEAMALGVPLVLAAGGPLEAIASARFTPPGDDEALADQVISLLSDDAQARELGERGRAFYEARFHPRVVAAKHDELYDELVRA